jgi:hypothetical protein
MLFARAMSNGVRWYCPDVFSGAPTYTPEELGADVTESGDVIPGSFVEATTRPAPKPVTVTVPTMSPVNQATIEAFTGEPVQGHKITMTVEEAMNEQTRENVPYGSIETSKLALMSNSLMKAMRSSPLSAEDRAEKERKHAAISIILAHREANAK